MNRFFIIALLSLSLAGCGRAPSAITLATTTSTRDSGLLDQLLPRFQEKTGIQVKVVAVGTGQALELGRRGDADVLLVHDPEGEKQFMTEGHGESRQEVFYNDFVLAGPAADPADLRAAPSLEAALGNIARTGSPFVSRGDKSGTHQKEKALWKNAGINPSGTWYLSVGAGMAEALRMASEKNAYVLTDRSTFLAQGKKLDLVILHENASALLNQYSVIVVHPDKLDPSRHAAAKQFAAFLESPEAVEIISAFGRDRFGQPLFVVGVAKGK